MKALDITLNNSLDSLESYLLALAICIAAALVALALSTIIIRILIKMESKEDYRKMLRRYLKSPLRVFFCGSFVYIAILITVANPFLGILGDWFYKLFWDFGIFSVTWMLVSLLKLWEYKALNRFEFVSETSTLGFTQGLQKNRYIRTQITVLRRLISVVLILVAIVLMLIITFDAVRKQGAAIFASASVLSVILGLAAQSTLGNLFAGVQIALTGAIRLGDIVRLIEDWGVVEKITMTYVVVHVWDDRRIIVPSSYFTKNSFGISAYFL
jgi:small-conductance mechanosensitive channel